MTALFEDNFELYGDDPEKMLDGVWAEINSGTTGDVTLEIPAWEEEGRRWLNMSGRGAQARNAFPAGGVTALGVWGQFYFETLPSKSNYNYLFQLRDSGNDNVAGVKLNTDGTLSVHGTDEDTVLATTSTPVIQASTTHDVQVEFNVSTDAIEIRVDGTSVLTSASATGMGSNTVTGYAHYRNNTSDGATTPYFVKASCAYSLAGTYNNSWPNISGIKTVLINADTATNNLTPRPRNHFDLPVAFINGRNDDDDSLERHGFNVSTFSTEFDYGTGDYTIEGWFRWENLPEADDTQMLMGVWDEDQDDRSYVLSLKGSNVDGGGLQFQYSTDGTGGTVTTVHDVNWEPQIGLWYHIAVARDSSTNDNRLFINGVQQGGDQTDSATYNASAVPFTIGNGYDNNELDLHPMLGFVQGVRVTKGIVRYTANFTPATALWPEDVGGDSDFTSVSLLVQFDDATEDPPVDHSGNTFTMVETSGADVIDYADTAASYLAAGTTDPFDDRYLESALPKATAVLSNTGNPSDGDTVTIDTDTFTFKTTLTPTAGEILIGANATETLGHLAAAINGEAGSGTDYAAATTVSGNYTAIVDTPTAGQVTFQSVLGGTAANSYPSTETSTVLSFGGATFSGGAALPGASEFDIQSLPPDATGVRWLSIRHRSYVKQGSATIETKLDVNASESAANSEGMTSDPQYYTHRIEEDPDTSAGLTVSSIENAKLKIERTA